MKNIDPQVANICRTHTAMQDLTFQQVAKIARRADRQTPDVQPPQVAIRRSVHAVSATMQGVSNEGNPSPKTQSLSIQAIREAVKEELARERTSKQQEVEDTIGQLKRELSTLQVLQVQQDARADSRGPPPNKSRERGGGGGDRSARTQPANNRVRLLPEGICSKCGSSDHLKCAWKDACTYCRQVGHNEVVCFRRIRDQGPRTEAK